jgi:hypothetical protein
MTYFPFCNCGSWGSPAQPSETQIEELKAYTELRPHLLPWTTGGATPGADAAGAAGAATVKKTATVIMPPNTAAVVVV